MVEHPADPRAAELLRRRAEKNGPASPPPPVVEPRKLDDADRAAIRAIAAAHPGWSPKDVADDFEATHGWRPSPQGIGRTLADAEKVEAGPDREPTPPRPGPARKPAGHGHADPEVGAMSLIAMALEGLDQAATRRVLNWALARFAERS